MTFSTTHRKVYKVKHFEQISAYSKVMFNPFQPRGEHMNENSQSRSGSQKKVDVTQQEANAHKFLAIFSSPSAGIIIKDREGYIVDWSAGAQNIMGYAPEEMIGKTSDSYTHSQNLEAIAAINRRLDAGETISFTNTVVNHKNGEKIICSTSFCPILDSTQAVTGSVVIFHDVTAEKLAEQKRLEMETELKKSHSDIAAILTEIPAPICVVDEASGAILSVNAAFAAMCGTVETQIVGSLLTGHMRDEHGQIPDMGQILERLSGGEVVSCALHRPDAAEVELMGRRLVFQDRRAIAVHCMDLTLRRAQENALREAVQAAEDASKMKSAFLANMSHEIRTPLNGVVGFAELALDEAGISAGVRNWLEKIKVSANGLLEIINDILDISKIEAGRIELEHAPFSLHDILQICETIITPRAEEKGVTLYLYAEPLLNRKFVGDQTRLRQILLNLLSNAVKFTNVGIVKLMSNVEELGDGKVVLSFDVKDSGIGMTSAQTQKIFEPFAQADISTTRKYGGTGLGLAITRNLVELMGGELHVESAPGIGSKFSFSLTLDTVAEAPETTNVVPAQGGIQEKPQFRGTVLVCEDNIINQQVIQEHLSRVGLEALIAPNGKLGVEQIKSRLHTGPMFDLIFMDIHMPVMDGLEATEKLLAMGITTPIVALTANAMASDRKNYLSHGMADYLAKPFRACELWECLLRHLTPETPVAGASAALQTASALPAAPVPVGPRPSPATARAPFSRPDDQSDDTVAVDRMRGIENAAGNTALYIRLLTNFMQDNRDFIPRFTEALQAGNRGLAHRMAHTLKGVAGTIGAMRLYILIRDFESSLNDGKVKEALDNLPPLRVELAAVFAELPPLLNAEPPPREEGTEGEGDGVAKARAEDRVLDQKQALDLAKHLAPLLATGESECLEYLDAVNDVFAPLGEQARLLAEQISEYDFDLAVETLETIKARLEADNG